MPAGVCGEMHTDNQGLWTQSSLQVLFSIRTLYSNQSFGFSLNTLCLLPQNFLPSSPFYLHHLPQILQVWLLLILQLSSDTSQTQRKRSCYPSLCWPFALCPPPSLVYFWVLFFTLFYFNTCSAECLSSLLLPPPTHPKHELRISFVALLWLWYRVPHA